MRGIVARQSEVLASVRAFDPRSLKRVEVIREMDLCGNIKMVDNPRDESDLSPEDEARRRLAILKVRPLFCRRGLISWRPCPRMRIFASIWLLVRGVKGFWSQDGTEMRARRGGGNEGQT